MKTFKNINIFLIITMIIINIIYIIGNLVNSQFSILIFNALLFIMLAVPFLVKKILKIKLSELFIFLYNIYIILTVLLGDVMQLIKYTLWYDKIVHAYFGFLIAILAVLIMKYNKNLNNNIFFNILFIIGFTLMLANFWEFIEYGLDKMFDSNHQRYKQTGVDDTMLDLLAAFLASIIVSINYFIETKVNKKGLVYHSILSEDINPEKNT